MGLYLAALLAALPAVLAQDYGHVACVLFVRPDAPPSESLGMQQEGCAHYEMSSSGWTAQFMFAHLRIPKCGMGKIKCATMHLLGLARETWPFHHVLFLDSRDVLCEHTDVVSRLYMHTYPDAPAIALGPPALGLSGIVFSPDGLAGFLHSVQTETGPYCKCLLCSLPKLAVMEHRWVARKKPKCFLALSKHNHAVL